MLKLQSQTNNTSPGTKVDSPAAKLKRTRMKIPRRGGPRSSCNSMKLEPPWEGIADASPTATYSIQQGLVHQEALSSQVQDWKEEREGSGNWKAVGGDKNGGARQTKLDKMPRGQFSMKMSHGSCWASAKKHFRQHARQPQASITPGPCQPPPPCASLVRVCLSGWSPGTGRASSSTGTKRRLQSSTRLMRKLWICKCYQKFSAVPLLQGHLLSVFALMSGIYSH